MADIRRRQGFFIGLLGASEALPQTDEAGSPPSRAGLSDAAESYGSGPSDSPGREYWDWLSERRAVSHVVARACRPAAAEPLGEVS